MSRYKAYPEYKDSGIEWLGEIPHEWHSTKVKFGYQITLGKMLQKEQKEYTQVYRPYLKAVNIQNSGVQVEDVESMWFSPSEIQSLRLKKGDVLISEGGDVGRAAVWKDELPECYIQNAINRARPKGARSGKFLYYWMAMLKSSDYINILCNKATIAHYTVDKLESSPIFLPPNLYAEQIANFLDHETAKIDTLIAKQQELIKLLKEKRQAVISHAVTKGLNPNAPMRDSGVEWLGEVPAHWVVSRLKFNCSVKGRIGFRGYTVEDLVDRDDGALVLGASEMTLSGELVLDSCPSISWRKFYESPEIMLKPGMLLFVQRGSTVGKVAYVPEGLGHATINPSLIVLRDIRMRPIFLTYCLMSSSIQTVVKIQTSTTAIPMISQEQVGNYWQCIPPIEEQVQIESYIQDQLIKLDSAINTAQKSIELSSERRTALISAAVTGKIDVRDWQPPSESAIAA